MFQHFSLKNNGLNPEKIKKIKIVVALLANQHSQTVPFLLNLDRIGSANFK
jgi:hypothetical protein